ncbi:putative XdhC and CoxI family protein [Octadecabacter antarcticus 307]|uniref:Putative XdhC and CoxI family protein n=2 Tax=Octadecabacter TaxID=53945 RepID=M9R9T5_9RHOB|nr:putative XdhC and CoxI family protein [Octadecabacter antarcticus 307]
MLSVNMRSPECSIDYAEHALDILEATVALIKDGQRCALVASLAVEGGAAREVGSLAVVVQNGSMIGYLSNGCIDRDIVLHGLDAIETRQTKHIRYGAGSPFMDLSLPCGGALDLVIDPSPDLKTLIGALDALRERKPATISFCPGKGLIASNGGPKRFCYAPKPALVLAGRGAILRTTVDLAAKMDFELHVASPDAADMDSLSALNPKSMHRMTTPAISLDLPIDAHTAVLLLFHDHEWEQALLMRAAKMGPFFLGALGSRKTHGIRLQNLQDSGLEPELCKTIRGPIGLVPSLRSASLIAVSALAEVTSNMPASQVAFI